MDTNESTYRGAIERSFERANMGPYKSTHRSAVKFTNLCTYNITNNATDFAALIYSIFISDLDSYFITNISTFDNAY